MSDKRHSFPVRVYFEDTDTGGIVYHANYLRFMERARTEYLRDMGIDHRALMAGSMGDSHMFVVRRMEIDYRKPAKLDDQLVVITTVTGVTGASFTMDQTVWRDDDIMVSGKVLIAVVGADGGVRRIPKPLRHIFNTLVCSSPP